MESFSLQGISLSSLPAATAYHNNSNNNTSTTVNNQNPAAPYVSAINKYAQEKENVEKTLKQQLMEIKREEEKQIDDDMLAKMMLEEASLSNKLKGKKGLELAFETRIELVKGVKSTLEFTKEQVNNISTLIDKYESQLKQGDTDYASKALHLLNNISDIKLSDNIIQEPMHQVFDTLFKFYGKYTSGGASNQLDGLGDNLTVETLGLSNKSLKELPEALDKAISQVDDIFNQIENKYKGLFGKDIEKRPNSKIAKSCDEIQKWLDYSIEHNELNNDRIGYSTVEIDERQMHFKTGTLISPQQNTVDIYI